MVLDAITKRRSVREYKADVVSEKDVNEILKAAMFAPTAMNNRSIEYVVVRDAQTKGKIADAIVPKQNFIKDAPVIIVPVIDASKSVLPMQDLSLATMTIFIQATSLGLGTLWKNVPSECAFKIKEILGVPKNYALTNVIPIGYPKSEPQPHSDKEFDEKKIHAEKW